MELDRLLEIRQFKAFELEEKAGEVLILGDLENTDKACPTCGKEAQKTHQYYRKRIRHLSILNKPTYLCFTQRLMRCKCSKLFLERLDFWDLHRHQTKAYEMYVYELCRGQDTNRVSELEQLSWGEVAGIFKKGSQLERRATSSKRCGAQPIPVSG